MKIPKGLSEAVNPRRTKEKGQRQTMSYNTLHRDVIIKINIYYVYAQIRWWNGERVCLQCGRSWGRGKPKTKIGICCFSAKHAALRSKSKDWWARNNVS